MKKKIIIITLPILIFILSILIDKDTNETVITNEIDYELIEKLYETDKIIVKENNTNKIIREINDYKIIYEFVTLMQSSTKTIENFNCDGYQYNLEMYDENEKLLDIIHTWTNNERVLPESLNKGTCAYYKIKLNKISFNDLIEGKIVRRDFERINELEGVSIEIIPNTLTNTGLKLETKNKKNKKLIFNKDYRIHKKENEKWIELEEMTRNNTVFYEEKEKGPIIEFNWKKTYGKLSSGRYRIVTSVYNKEDGNVYFIGVEFKID